MTILFCRLQLYYGYPHIIAPYLLPIIRLLFYNCTERCSHRLYSVLIKRRYEGDYEERGARHD